MSRLFYISFVVVSALIAVDTLCNMPCVYMDRRLYDPGEEGDTFELSCDDTSRYFRVDEFGKREIRECVESSGPFRMIRRQGNFYRCVKMAVIEPNGSGTLSYVSPYRMFCYTPYQSEHHSAISDKDRLTERAERDPIDTIFYCLYKKKGFFKTRPDICDVCTSDIEYTIKGVFDINAKPPKSPKIPPMGCNRPVNCPIQYPMRDIPCTGCERQAEVETTCCARCFRKRMGVFHFYGHKY